MAVFLKDTNRFFCLGFTNNSYREVKKHIHPELKCIHIFIGTMDEGISFYGLKQLEKYSRENRCKTIIHCTKAMRSPIRKGLNGVQKGPHFHLSIMKDSFYAALSAKKDLAVNVSARRMRVHDVSLHGPTVASNVYEI